MGVDHFERELMRGIAPMAVMTLISERPMYGYEIVQTLAQRGQDVLAMGQGTLYPLLYNLESKKLVRGKDATASNGRKRRYYELTAAGHRQLKRQKAQWHKMRTAVDTLVGAPFVGAAQ